MKTTTLDKAKAMIAGIGARDPALATLHVHPTKFTEHDPHVANGIDGLRQYVRQFGQTHSRRIVRTLQDGAFVVTHSEGIAVAHANLFDVFRFADHMIVEHWAFSAIGAPPNQSGHTQTDGPTQVKATEDTTKNKALVREYYETVHVEGNHAKIPHYFAGNACIRHEPGVRDGVEEFRRDLERLVKTRSIDQIKFTLGEGDFVFIAALGTHERRPCAYLDLYRVQSGKIAERWGFSQQVPLEKDWKNDNGIL